MIGDVKTDLDRYLTHSLTRTLDRQSSNYILLHAGRSDGHATAKKRDGTRTRVEKTHHPHTTRTYTTPT